MSDPIKIMGNAVNGKGLPPMPREEYPPLELCAERCEHPALPRSMFCEQHSHRHAMLTELLVDAARSSSPVRCPDGVFRAPRMQVWLDGKWQDVVELRITADAEFVLGHCRITFYPMDLRRQAVLPQVRMVVDHG